ncbi:MAG: transposase [Pirellulales bacterium]
MYCHLVFSTKDRVRAIESDLQPRLFEYMGGTLRRLGGRLIAAGGVPDHTHLLVSMGKQDVVADLVRDTKLGHGLTPVPISCRPKGALFSRTYLSIRHPSV